MKKFYFLLSMLMLGLSGVENMAAQDTAPVEMPDSVKNILAQARGGDAEAQNLVGAWYYSGKHVAQDYAEAAQWWAKSARQGNVKAIGNLGMCYAAGNGVEKDSLRAVGLFDKSISGGNEPLFDQIVKLADKKQPFYCMLLADCYKRGIGTKKNPEKAAEYYHIPAAEGSLEAQKELGMLLLNSKKEGEAAKWFKMGADQKDAMCQFYYGKIIHDGLGVASDAQEGIIYLIQAAEGEFPMAYYELAKAYYDGNGVVRNPEQGAQWLVKAANEGISNAQYELALNYVNGDGVPVDFDQATTWFATALPKGHTNAFKKLFEAGDNSLLDTPYHSYLKGLDYYQKKDFANALKQFKIVEKGKHKEGKVMIGVILANKDYEKYNLSKGVKALRDGADNGVAMAQFLLGTLYEAGKGVDKDMPQALAWLEKGASLNYAPALCYLGDMYYEGRGVDQDYGKAVEYYLKAKGQLTPNAAKRLAACYENGQGIAQNPGKGAELRKKPVGTSGELLKLINNN